MGWMGCNFAGALGLGAADWHQWSSGPCRQPNSTTLAPNRYVARYRSRLLGGSAWLSGGERYVIGGVLNQLSSRRSPQKIHDPEADEIQFQRPICPAEPVRIPSCCCWPRPTCSRPPAPATDLRVEAAEQRLSCILPRAARASTRPPPPPDQLLRPTRELDSQAHRSSHGNRNLPPKCHPQVCSHPNPSTCRQ